MKNQSRCFAAANASGYPVKNQVSMQFLVFAQSGFWNWLTEMPSDQPGELKWQWAGLPESWGVFVWIAAVLGIAAAVFWLYRRESGTAPAWVRTMLACVRFVVLLGLVILLLRPSIYFQQVTIVKPNIALLRDSSQSMARGDRYPDDETANRLAALTGLSAGDIKSGKVPRAELLNRALVQNNSALLTSVRDKGSINTSDFSDKVSPVSVLPALNSDLNSEKPNAAGNEKSASEEKEPSEQSETKNSSLPDLNPNGPGTDIWGALRETLDNANRLGAIVLVSEGQHNGGEDPVELARRAGELDIPIFTVGLGDPTPARNLTVVDVTVRSQAYPDEPFEIETLLQANLPAEDAARGGKLKVDLVQERIDPATGERRDPQIVESREVELPEKSGRLRVDFSHMLREPGQYVYTLKAAELERETDVEDNVRTSAILKVVDEKVRVLLIAGLPSWDYQQVQRLLQRDPSVRLSCWLQSMDEERQQEGDEPITDLPRTLADLGNYNVIILIDPNPEEFDEAWIDSLQQFCRNKAGGVLYMAGPQYTSEFITMNRLRGFLDLLPVKFGDAASIAASQVIAEANDAGGGMVLVNHNLDHPVMSFSADSAENLSRWNQMPGFTWNFPTESAKPMARVLLERGSQSGVEGNQPALVAGRFGAGSVLYFGFQGTWRWRRVGLQAQFFDRFWIQVIRYLVENRSLQGSRRGFVDCDQPEYELGSKVTLLARFLDEQFQPSSQPTLQAIISDDQRRQQKVNLQLIPGQPGQYEGSFAATRTGSFEVTLDVPNAGSEQLIETATLRVVPPSAEANAYWLNEKLLREIAEQSGGKYFRLTDLQQLPAALPTLETRAEFNSPPRPVWDLNRLTRYLALLLPVALLGFEWAVRKWFKLM
jgi:hypothetical protein